MRRSPHALFPFATSLLYIGIGAVLVAACSTDSAGGDGSTSTDPAANEPAGSGGAGRTGGSGASPSGPSSTDGSASPPTTDGSVDGEPLDPGPPAVQFIGRFDWRSAAGPSCAWPGCRIVARFQGPEVKARLNELDDSWMQGAPSEWDVSIDHVLGEKLVMTPGQNEFVLATNLPPGVHEVELYKRSEAQNGTTQFLGFDFGEGGVLEKPPLRKSRRIEIIGDSQPAAFGIEGAVTGIGPNCPEPQHAARYQNFHRSFGAVLGTTFDAEVAGTVYSGKGIAKNIWHPDKETMPFLFGRGMPVDPSSPWDFKAFVPDVVVLMLGGNDFAVGRPVDEGPATLEAFTTAYQGFVVDIRKAYPNAWIILTVSPSASDTAPVGNQTRTNIVAGIASVISQREAAGDTKVRSFAPGIAAPAELNGCNGHGNPAFHQRVANEIGQFFKPLVGW